MPKWRLVVISLLIIVTVLVAFFTLNWYLAETSGVKKEFLVGVTFCGNTTQEAKLLVDRVRNCTNLFVLQSGELMVNESAVLEIGDYAVSNGLRFAAYFDPESPPQQASWVNFTERWGSMFAGVYYGDEPGGKMLDANVILSQTVTSQSGGNQTATIVNPNIIKFAGGAVQFGDTTYYSDGSMTVVANFTVTNYYPNETITLREFGGDFFTMENGTDRISRVNSYQEVSSRNPLSNCSQVAEVFENRNWKFIEDFDSHWQLENRSFPMFTADYALYWWDFKSGYDLVLAELGWNNTVAQEIGLVRGAADLQGKRWGTIITWTYTEWPYLVNGTEMYEQMRLSYESGAEYVVIFNYAKDMKSPYGTLQDEHFDALDRFWTNVVRNPAVVHGGIKAEAAFVLPKNYGWGLRDPDDLVWGLWEPTTGARQTWTLLQAALAEHNLRLDVVYDDPAYPIAGRYRHVYCWNQTG